MFMGVTPSAANLPADCINLGQGYMNFAPPEWVKNAAEEALNSVATNHYSHPKGRLRLREALKSHYEPEFGRKLDVESEILITSGANEGPSVCIFELMAIRLILERHRSILRLRGIPGTGR